MELLDAQTLDAEIDELLHVTQGGRNAAMTPLFYLYSRFFDVFLTALRRRDVPMDRVYDIQDHYNQEAQDADTPQALTAALRTWTAGQLRLLRQQNREPGTAIELAQQYIRKNYARPLTRTDLAALVGFNPNYFSTCFHAVTGVRFSDYLQKIRIERAKQLLTTTLLPIAEVSRQVGYPDYRHFCKLFSRQAGLPPSEYRKRRRGLAEESPQG